MENDTFTLFIMQAGSIPTKIYLVNVNDKH